MGQVITVQHGDTNAVTRATGMRDVPPARLAAREAAIERMLAVTARAGYARVDVPVIEATELFLRTAGEERVQQMFTLRARNRELCLRPEFTVSVVRAAVEQDAALPARVAYCGPVFRHDQPGHAAARQMTDLGAELMGARSAAADAEVIGLAFAALQAAGVAHSTVVLGHVGVARANLVARRLDERVRDWLVWSMERMRADDPGGERIHPALAAMLAEDARLPERATVAAVDRETFLALLSEAGISLDGNRRAPEEIADGLMRKLARRGEHPDVHRALAFLRRLVALVGTPEAVLPQLDALVAAEGVANDEAARLRAVLALLPAYGIPPEAVTLDLGLGRGLTYYTGIVFECVAADGVPLGGGGRYDDLATRIGRATPLPAVGFSLHIEPVLDAFAAPPVVSAPPVVVVRAGAGDAYTAARIASRLRALGWTAVLAVDGDGPVPHALAVAEPTGGGEAMRWQPFVGNARTIPLADSDAWPLPPHRPSAEGPRDE